MPYNGPFDLAWVRERLPGRHIEWYSSIDSTMTAAARLAREGCPSGTVVGADEQSAGIGRHGHTWHSESGAGLYVSLVIHPLDGVIRPPIQPHPGSSALPLVMLALGLATQEAIAQTSGLAPDLRWPNDVLLEGKKCAGILAQMEGDAVVAGIGINVGHAEFPEELRELATSLAIARASGDALVRREGLLVALVCAIDETIEVLRTKGSSAILDMFTRGSSYVIGRRVKVDQAGAVVEGVTCGLDPSGFLRVRQDNGIETVILAGGVRPA
jgi:BirA family biotin operon repressor/biotin-[acetyl-CoA-carboxylase] ligase